MIKKQRTRLLPIAAAVIFMMTESAYADSAANSGTLVTPITATANQMFLLDSGSVDYMPAGGQWVGTDSQAACTASTPGCVGVTHFKGLCPKNFVPYFITTPFKSAQSQTSATGGNVGTNAICVSNWSVTAGKNYNIGFGLTSTSSGTSISKSGNAFNWYIYCYPGTYVATNGSAGNPNGATYNNAANCDSNPSSCSVAQGSIPTCNPSSLAPAGADKQPLLWDTGFINAGTGNTWYNTNRQCPPGYNPYITTSMNTSRASDVDQTSGSSSQQPGASILCYNKTFGFDDANPNYYKFQVYFTQFNGSLGNAGGQWNLYCYPSGMTVPSYPSCNVPAKTVVQYSQTFNFGQIGAVNSYNSTVYSYAQTFNPSNQGQNWTIAFSGNQYNASPQWNTFFAVPISGTYMLSMSTKIYNTDTNSACQLALYIAPQGTGFNVYGTYNNVRMPIAPASSGNIGVTTSAFVINSIYLTAGTWYSVYGVQWNSVCNSLYISSDGSLTVTRIGN